MGRIDDDRDAPVTSEGGGPLAVIGGRWGRRIITGLIAFAALGGFAAVVIYSYDKGREAGTGSVAPVIQAQEGPTKIKPETPGGMAVPNQDKQVYSRIDPSQAPPKVERLLPPAEAPVARPAAPAEPAPPPPAEPASGPAPAPAAPEPPPVQAAKKAEPPPEPDKGPPPAKPAPAAEPPVTAPPPPGAKVYKVQLASFRAEADAKRAWTRVAAQHKDLFGNLSPTYARAEIKNKGTYYRLQAGPLADAAAARALCEKAKSRKLGCLIVRP
jgi:hypothetical protein